MRKYRRNKNVFLIFFLILILLALAGIRLITNTAFRASVPEAVNYAVFHDEYVKVSIVYSDKNRVLDNGTTFVSEKNNYSNDIMLIVENLKSDGIIFTPTPKVTIVNSRGKVISNISPYIMVPGVANPDDSTYISFTNPIPNNSIKAGTYSYTIDIQYQYIINCGRVSHTDTVSHTINMEVINPNPINWLLQFNWKLVHYVLIVILLALLIMVLKRRK